MKSRSSGRSSGGAKMERKEVEKNRRMHMKGLCLKLASLIPKEHFSSKESSGLGNKQNMDSTTQLDHLDEAAAYIQQLRERIDELKQKKEPSFRSRGAAAGVSMPVIEVRYRETILDVVLISKVGEPFRLHEVITVLEQEGAEVVSASFSVIGDKIFYTIHSQALSPRIGLEASKVSERLHELVWPED